MSNTFHAPWRPALSLAFLILSTLPMSFPGLVSAARGEPQAQGIVCTVGYGKTGISKGVAYSLTWKKYCGPKVDYCYRAHTASPGDMKKLYPEHPWDDTSAFYSEFYVMGCGDDFGFSHTEGCTGTVRRPRIKTNTPPAEHTGPDKEELGSFEVDYCCYNSGCTSGAASLRLGLSIAVAAAATALSFAFSL